MGTTSSLGINEGSWWIRISGFHPSEGRLNEYKGYHWDLVFPHIDFAALRQLNHIRKMGPYSF